MGVLTFHCLASDTPYHVKQTAMAAASSSLKGGGAAAETSQSSIELLQNNILEGNAQWDMLPAEISSIYLFIFMLIFLSFLS